MPARPLPPTPTALIKGPEAVMHLPCPHPPSPWAPEHRDPQARWLAAQNLSCLTCEMGPVAGPSRWGSSSVTSPCLASSPTARSTFYSHHGPSVVEPACGLCCWNPAGQPGLWHPARDWLLCLKQDPEPHSRASVSPCESDLTRVMVMSRLPGAGPGRAQAGCGFVLGVLPQCVPWKSGCLWIPPII